MPEALKLSPAGEAALLTIPGGAVSKSMTTGYAIGGTDQEGAAALRRESLAPDLKRLTFDNSDFTIFPEIPKLQAKSTVEQYAILDNVGTAEFVSEMGIATVSDPHLAQHVVRMKYLAATRQMSIAAGLVNNTVDPMQVETDSAMTSIASLIEWAIFYGDSDMSSLGDGNGLQFDGLAKLIDQKNNVTDLRGENLREIDLNNAATVIAKGFGKATDAYMPIGVQAEFDNGQLDRQYVQMSAPGQLISGMNVTAFRSTRGLINLHGSTIMDSRNILNENFVPNQMAPAAPTVSAKVAKGAGKFFDTDIAEVTYKVRAVGANGGSRATEVKAAIVEKESEVTLLIEQSAMYNTIADSFEIYRQGKETGAFYLVGSVAASKLVGNKISFIDVNDTIPETADVFVGEMTSQVLGLYELLPMMRLPLPQMTAAITFSVLWYGALGLFAPKKWVRIKNVKYVPGQVH